VFHPGNFKDLRFYPDNILHFSYFTRIIFLVSYPGEPIMTALEEKQCIAFEGNKLVAQGNLREVRDALRKFRSLHPEASILVFDDQTGEDFDLEDSPVSAQGSEPAAEATPVRPGRPKLGVVAREITLLPRHWQWLETQSGGASVALRKLVEVARKQQSPEDRARQAIEAAYRFLSVMSAHVPNFEDVARALFRRDWLQFDRSTQGLPLDVREHLRRLAAPARPEFPDAAEH
jgi:uncharacterized protein